MVTAHVDLCNFIKISRFFLEWEMFQTKVLEKFKMLILFNNFFSRKSCRLRDNVEEKGIAGQATDDNMIKLLTHT